MQSETKYEYDAQKNMTKQTQYNYNTAGEQTSVSGSMFEDYVNGMYQVMKNFNATGDVTSETHYEYTFDDQKQVLSMVQLTGAAFDQKNQGTFYTYENGKLVKEVMAYYNAAGGEGHEWDNVQNTTNYTYNADGTIATRSIVSDTSYGHSEIEWRYTYSTLDPSLIPQGLTCDGTIGGNEVYVKWNAVAGAEKYLVMYDNQTAEVEGKTDFITPMLNDGEHQVAVLAYVAGRQLQGMANIGRRPTLNNGPQLSIEVNLFDFDDDIYGEDITLEFISFLRLEFKMCGLEELKRQLTLDKENAQRLLKEYLTNHQ